MMAHSMYDDDEHRLRVYEKPPGGWDKWLRKHVWTYVGIAAPLLGSPGALKSVMSGHTFGLTISEAQARELGG